MATLALTLSLAAAAVAQEASPQDAPAELPQAQAARDLLESIEMAAAAGEISEDDPLPSEVIEALDDLRAGSGPDPEILDAIETFRKTGVAPVVQQSSVTYHPFGQTQPMLTCTENRVCLIELEIGEQVYTVACGDCIGQDGYSQNGALPSWFIEDGWVGDEETPAPLFLVRPLRPNTATNLIIATNRRVYHIGLHSPARADLAEVDTHYERHLSFYYPNKLLRQITTLERARERSDERRAARAAQTARGTRRVLAASPEALNFDYDIGRLRGAKRRSIGWIPSTVYDDGTRTFIHLDSDTQTLPSILISDGNESIVPNTHWEGRTLVVHRLFDEATLFQGVGKKRIHLTIRRDA